MTVLTVVHKGRLVGLVSIRDIVKAIITGQAKIINSLENFVIGAEYLTV
jgi:CBS domain-containing protein